MSVTLSPVGGAGAQFFDNNGNPLSGGKLYTYAAGTTTPVSTYTSAAGSTLHTNPIVLDSAGRVPGSSEIWLTDGVIYKFLLKTSVDVTLATWDNITGVNSNFVNFTAESEYQTATAGQTVFTLTTMTYSPGTGNLTVYVDGVNQYLGTSYVETDGATVTFTAGLHVGALVKFTTAVETTGNATDASVVTYTPAGTGAVTTTVQAKLRETVSVKDFGAVGDGVTDDWTAIQTAICYANTYNAKVYVPAGTYAHSKTLFFSCSDMALATASSNGENIFGSGTLFYTNTCIEGDGVGNTVFLYTGANHAVQVGEFSDSSYGYANKATFQSTFRDFTVESSGTPKKGIAASWIHYVYFEKIDVRGDYTEQNWFIDRGFSTINRPSLWNKFIEIEGRSYTADINFYLYGNSNQVQGFFAGGSDVVFDVVGSRNVHQVWAENSPTSGLSNAFIRAEGYNTFISPDLETGGGGVNYGFILNTGYTLISQPITVGISSSVIDPSSTGDYFIYPQLVAASTNPTNGRMQILSSKPIYGQYLPKWTYRAKETTGIPIDPVSFANITTLQSAGLAGDSYASGLVFHGIKLSDCTQNSTLIQIGAYVSDTLSWSSKTVTMNIGDTLYIDDKDLNFYFGQLDASVRLIVVRARASSAGTVTANTITIEATNLLP